MDHTRSADTFVVRIRRDPSTPSPQERWQIEHVQTGFKVYVHGLDEATSVIRSCLSRIPAPTDLGNPKIT